MNISNHCFERYHERVREAEGPFVQSLKERYTKELDALYEHCTKIYSGIIGHSSRPVDVYVNPHGWVLIVNDKERTLITVYRVDLGIGDDELNKKYISQSLKRINELQEALLEKAVKIDEQKASCRKHIEANDALIKEHTNVINELKDQNSGYNDLIKSLDANMYQEQVALRDAIENYMVKDSVKIELDIK